MFDAIAIGPEIKGAEQDERDIVARAQAAALLGHLDEVSIEAARLIGKLGLVHNVKAKPKAYLAPALLAIGNVLKEDSFRLAEVVRIFKQVVIHSNHFALQELAVCALEKIRPSLEDVRERIYISKVIELNMPHGSCYKERALAAHREDANLLKSPVRRQMELDIADTFALAP